MALAVARKPSSFIEEAFREAVMLSYRYAANGGLPPTLGTICMFLPAHIRQELLISIIIHEQYNIVGAENEEDLMSKLDECNIDSFIFGAAELAIWLRILQLSYTEPESQGFRTINNPVIEVW